MAPTIKWQRWDAANYNWLGQNTTDALPSLEAELDAWIATVNGIASNAGRQLAKKRGYASSTTTNYAGLVIEAGANNNTEKGYLQYISVEPTRKSVYAGDTFSDDTSKGGYGTVSGGSADTVVTWRTSGSEANFLLVYDTTDGQEFFAMGPSFGTTGTSVMDGFVIFKCTDGEWAMASSDASFYHVTHYWGADNGGWNNCGRTSSADNAVYATAYVYSRFSIVKAASGGTSYTGRSDEPKPIMYAANPALLSPNESSKYNQTGTRRVFTDLGDGTNVFVLSCYYYGPCVLVDLRP